MADTSDAASVESPEGTGGVAADPITFYGSFAVTFSPLRFTAAADASLREQSVYLRSTLLPVDPQWTFRGQGTDGAVCCQSCQRRVLPPGVEESAGEGRLYAPFVVQHRPVVSSCLSQSRDKTGSASAEVEAARSALQELEGNSRCSESPDAAAVAQPMVVSLLPSPPQHCKILVECVQEASHRVLLTQVISPVDFARLSSEDAEFSFVVPQDDSTGDAVSLATFRCAFSVIDLHGGVASIVDSVADLGVDDSSVSADITPAHSRQIIPCDFSANASSRLPPYGCMPLFCLYDHHVHFFRVHLQQNIRPLGALRSALGQSAALKSTMLCSLEALRNQSGAACRWDMLSQVDCSKVILGDLGFAPLSAVLMSASCVQRLDLSRNNLSLVSAKRLVAALRHNAALEELRVGGNRFFEFAGEELLRLLKLKPTLCTVCVDDNKFSSRLLERFRVMASFNAQQRLTDPYNALSPMFDYLVHMDAVPLECWQLVRPLWVAMTVVHKQPPNATSLPVGIPIAATAPLLSSLLRSVLLEMSKVYHDEHIRVVFAPVGSVIASEGTSADPEAQYLESYAKLFVTTLRVALDAPSRWEDCTSVLRAIGAAHERRGIRPSMYLSANRFLVCAIEAHFPEDTFTPDAKAALLQVLALMTRTAVRGMQEYA